MRAFSKTARLGERVGTTIWFQSIRRRWEWQEPELDLTVAVTALSTALPGISCPSEMEWESCWELCWARARRAGKRRTSDDGAIRALDNNDLGGPFSRYGSQCCGLYFSVIPRGRQKPGLFSPVGSGQGGAGGLSKATPSLFFPPWGRAFSHGIPLLGSGNRCLCSMGTLCRYLVPGTAASCHPEELHLCCGVWLPRQVELAEVSFRREKATCFGWRE